DYDPAEIAIDRAEEALVAGEQPIDVRDGRCVHREERAGHVARAPDHARAGCMDAMVVPRTEVESEKRTVVIAPGFLLLGEEIPNGVRASLCLQQCAASYRTRLTDDAVHR